MTSRGAPAPESIASFDERLAILTEELELAVKWQRPCLLLAVYSSEYVRADVEAAVTNALIDLGQKSIHLSVKRRDPSNVLQYFKEFKDPEHSVYLIDGLRWGSEDEDRAYAALSLQQEYFMERQIRAVIWLTPNEITKVAHTVPDSWTYRHRLIEFVESPKAEQVLKQALDSAWQGTGEYAVEFGDVDAKISLRESMLTELPKGEEAVSIRGNLLLTLGVLNWRRGDYERAEEQLHGALQIAAKIQDKWFEAQCFNALALLKSSTEQIDGAIDAYKQAIELAPGQIFVWNNLGNLCAKVGRSDEAMIAFRKALQGNSRDPIAWNGLANVHFKLGYVDDAIAAYRKALQYTPTYAQPWCGLGDVYASTGRTDEALKCYHQALELNKQYIVPWMRLGVLFAKQDRYRDAIKAYQKALELDSANSGVWNDLGLMYMKAESFGEAATAFSKAIDLDRGNGWAYSNLAFAYMQQGTHREGVSLLLRSIDLLEEDADKAVSWTRLAELYRSLNDYDNAMAAYQMADQLTKPEAAHEGQAPKAHDDVGASALPAEADGVSWAVALPTSPAVAGETVAETGEVEADTEINRQVPPEAPAWIYENAGKPQMLAAQDVKSGKTASEWKGKEAAVTQADEARDEGASTPIDQDSRETAAPKSAPAEEAAKWTVQGNAHFNRGALDEAILAYNNAIQMDPAYGVPYGNLALAYVTKGQFPEAILLYERSIELLQSDRDKALSWNGLGNAYRCMDDYANAVKAYQRAAELDPETSGIRDRADNFQPREIHRSAKGWNDLGVLLLKTGALDKAAEAFQRAIELEPTLGKAFSNLARVRAAEGKYTEAAAFYEKSLTLLESNKEKADAWNGLGNAYRKLNNYDKAIDSYQKAVTLADEGVDLLTRTRFSLLSNVFVNP